MHKLRTVDMPKSIQKPDGNYYIAIAFPKI